MIKIGIDPSGTGTTSIVVYEDNKLTKKLEFTNKDWINHANKIRRYKFISLFNPDEYMFNIEDCLYTSINASKDRDDLLRLLGAIENKLNELKIKFNWVSPKHTKSIVKNIENLSKYNDSCLWEFDKDTNLTYQYGKGWFYNNEKISHHIRDAIIIANYKG
ncbi:hypothetical protein [Spiroplasma endosymbiont of Megaselia nigra]|uniref:hypothetical protein n=1 Tax=Spiroplasma endosymbiont of Megaselia nigra TaxID=2478537 RepID=UPI000F8649BC|nr:hypothetical protein [Spiroplasma endosymbiont of Megaselia nigra]RUO86499.1 hypothetical protein D9R21_02695 [Spiroplasma endosymbiont of Megaselia nigra]